MTLMKKMLMFVHLNFCSSFCANSIIMAKLLHEENKTACCHSLDGICHPVTLYEKRLLLHTHCRLSMRWFHTVTWAPGSQCGLPGAPAEPLSCWHTPAMLWCHSSVLLMAPAARISTGEMKRSIFRATEQKTTRQYDWDNIAEPQHSQKSTVEVVVTS